MVCSPDSVIIKLGNWEALGPDASSIRESVFIAEQQVPRELEYDAWDAVSTHAVAYQDGQSVATGRLLPDGHIGRMAVHAHYRRLGLGGKILDALMAEAKTLGMAQLCLHAQVQAIPFYATRGFIAHGNTFQEAGIPHKEMFWRANELHPPPEGA
ncbi:MAG: GNAT family N-acetyltransferase [Pigmentiphaga sp.]|nr:GNAT family N-acetyltransferase [Pigmentiphaga sp.]